MTYEQVEQTVVALEAEGLRVSAAAIIQRIGGSKRDVGRHLRALRGTESQSQALTASALGSGAAAYPQTLSQHSPALGPASAPEVALACAPGPMPVSPRGGPVTRYRVVSRRFSRSGPHGGLVRQTHGTILDDVSPEELAAFPDVFERVEECTP